MPEGIRGGVRTHWHELGHGARPALAIHCALASGAAWGGVAQRLSDRIRLTAFDLPGHGKAADWPPGVDLFDTSLAMARDFTGEDRFDLIGHSFGGVVALRLAELMPERVRSLTLVEPVLFAAAAGSPELAEIETALAPMPEMIAAGRREEAARLFTGQWGTGEGWEATRPATRAYIADRIHVIIAGRPATHDDRPGILARGALEMLEMPVMLIRGGASPPVVGEIAEAIAARLPDVGVAVVPGAGHMLPITHPDAVAGLIAANLDRS